MMQAGNHGRALSKTESTSRSTSSQKLKFRAVPEEMEQRIRGPAPPPTPLIPAEIHGVQKLRGEIPMPGYLISSLNARGVTGVGFRPMMDVGPLLRTERSSQLSLPPPLGRRFIYREGAKQGVNLQDQ